MFHLPLFLSKKKKKKNYNTYLLTMAISYRPCRARASRKENYNKLGNLNEKYQSKYSIFRALILQSPKQNAKGDRPSI